MDAENAHRFDEGIAFFHRPRYDIVATGEVYDGADELGRLMHENVTAFPDFFYEVERLHHADEAIVVEGTFTGTHLGTWRGLPATGQKVRFPMLIVFPFEGEHMMGERIFFDLNTALVQLGVARDPNTVGGKVSTALNHPVTITRALLRPKDSSFPGRLPPGSMGLPLLGETLAFVRNPYGFLEERHRRYGNVFRSRVVGRKVVFLSGIEGAEAFYDPANITREDAHPFLLTDMFGGVNMEMYDGPRHVALKSMALEAFDAAALARYLPDLQSLIEATLEQLAGGGSFSATVELRRLALGAIARNLLGLAPGPETDELTRDYGTMLAGLASLVPVNARGLPYARAMEARDRLLARIGDLVRQRRATPGSDGLTVMLTARAEDGRTYTDVEAVLEVHHVVVAGFIVFALMAEAMRRLAEDPRLRERCREEIAANAPTGPLTAETLASMRRVAAVVMETKRLTPLVPLAFGRAARHFTCDGFDIPQGWTVYLALHLNNRDPSVFKDPERFDPDRFGLDRAEHHAHPMAFIPQGAEPPTGHRCLGLDYSTVLASAFVALLLRGYDWELPPQDLRTDWSKRPPEPHDGLRVLLIARRP
jgi:steroid delta-isomerase-like uncharacterized protein